MKKLVNMFVTVLVASISAIAPATAQYNRPVGTPSGPVGSGLYSIDVQRVEEITAVENTSYTAVFGNIEDARKIFRSDLSMPCDQIIDLQSKWIANQLGGKFDPSHPSDYTVTYEVVGPGFWDLYEDGYIIARLGSTLMWCDPRTSSVHKNRTLWVIMTITDNATGRTAKLLCNCGNPVRLKEAPAGYDETVQKTAYQAGPSAKAEATVVVRYEPGPQVPSFKPQPVVEKKNHTVVIVLAIAAAGGATYAILSHKSEPKDNVYGNKQPGHQGESGPTTTQGGEGDQQTWSLAYSLMQKFTPSLALKTSVAAPKSLFTFTKVIHLNWFSH